MIAMLLVASSFEGTAKSTLVGSLLVSHPGRTLLAVTHGGVIRTLERHLGIAPAGVGNLAGRWVEQSAGDMRAGSSVTLFDPDAPAPRTTVL